MTLNQIIFDIKEMLSQYTYENTLSDVHLAYIFTNKRNTYIRNYISNLKKELPIQAMQQICVTLEEDDICEDDFIYLKSTQRLPATIESTGRSNISQAYLNSRTAKWINIVDYQRWPYIKLGGRFNDKQLYITLDPDDYVLVWSPSNNHELIEDLKLNIIAEDPELAYNMQCNLDKKCEFFDSEYPIESSMIDPIKREILNELLIKYRIPTDIINNANMDEINKIPLDAGNNNQRRGN